MKMMNRICNKCNIEKKIKCFNFSRKNVLRSNCKECQGKYNKKNYKDNAEKISLNKKKYYKDNIQEIKINKKEYYDSNKEKFCAISRKYYQNNKKKIAKYRREKMKTDINYKLADLLRSRLSDAIRHSYKSGSAVKDLGCSIDDLKKHLESQFKKDMSWDNHGRYGWHIDHILPLASFNLENREEFLEACNYTNLQPLWASENFRKSNKIGDNYGW